MTAGRLLGLLTPMANPTVETEMRKLLPEDLAYVVGRLVSDHANSLDRLRQYAEDLPASLSQFGNLDLRAVAFACTGSGYLLGARREAEISRAASVPVLWATQTICDALRSRDVRRLAVVSPYPEELHQAGLNYWTEAGFEIVFETRLNVGSADTRAIYSLTADDARAGLAHALEARPEGVLLSGTGMPTLPLVDLHGQVPILSSNLCLANAMITAYRSA